MLQLKNTSPFEAAITLFPNEKGIDSLYVTIKATFTLGEKLRVADEQLPVIMADEYWGEPGKSSLKNVSELHLLKPSTDIVMKGEACAPEKRPVQALDVLLAVADKKKIVKVFGDRYWDTGIIGFSMSNPVPFESMPLVYERAYGGVHEVNPEKQKILFEAKNPIGKGFRGKRNKKELKGSLLPNLEDPAKLISKPGDRPTPACFSYIASSWEPRKSFAGTYDNAWQKNRAPFLPEDFDSRFFNSAHPDLICNGYLKGGEPVSIVNMSEKGPLNFKLPLCEIDLKVRVEGQIETPALNMETVLFEPNESRLSMIWRAAIECDKKALKIEQIDVDLKKIQIN